MFKTMVGIESEDEMKKVKKVCDDIKVKDSTWLFDIKKSYSNKFEYILTVFSDTQEKANHRGGWLVHKMKDAKVSSYFWVRGGNLV